MRCFGSVIFPARDGQVAISWDRQYCNGCGPRTCGSLRMIYQTLKPIGINSCNKAAIFTDALSDCHSLTSILAVCFPERLPALSSVFGVTTVSIFCPRSDDRLQIQTFPLRGFGRNINLSVTPSGGRSPYDTASSSTLTPLGKSQALEPISLECPIWSNVYGPVRR